MGPAVVLMRSVKKQSRLEKILGGKTVHWDFSWLNPPDEKKDWKYQTQALHYFVQFALRLNLPVHLDCLHDNDNIFHIHFVQD